MLVTFRSKNHGDFTMFGDIAKKLFGMMGHSGTIPGAIAADDIPEALERLQAAIAAMSPAEPSPDDFEGDPIERPVGIAQRAFPLIEMLEAAAEEGNPVMWDKG